MKGHTMETYSITANEIQSGDILVTTAHNIRTDEPRTKRLTVTRVRRVGAKVDVWTTLFPVPLYYGADALVAVER